jgi:Lon protease-like protein
MFPLGTVLFPGGALPLHVFEPRYRKMLTDCLSTERRFGVVLIARGSEVGGGDQRVDVGTEACIDEVSELPDGRFVLVATGSNRVTVDSWLPDQPYPQAIVRPRTTTGSRVDEGVLGDAVVAVRQAWALLSELGQAAVIDPSTLESPEEPVWRLCDTAPLGPLDRQRLLEVDDDADRLAVLLRLVAEVTDDLHRLLASGGSP